MFRNAGEGEEDFLAALAAGPDATVERVLGLLDENQHVAAQRLAAEAVERFPGHRRVANAWKLFDTQDKSAVSARGTQPNSREEFAWLRDPPVWAHGQWVALVGSEAVAVADTLTKLHEMLASKSLPRQPLIHRVANGW